MEAWGSTFLASTAGRGGRQAQGQRTELSRGPGTAFRSSGGRAVGGEIGKSLHRSMDAVKLRRMTGVTAARRAAATAVRCRNMVVRNLGGVVRSGEVDSIVVLGHEKRDY